MSIDGDTRELISCQGISMAYVPGIWVLKDISFSLSPGTVTAIVGENGAGKSTLYRIMAGMLKPTQGRVAVSNGHVTRLTPLAARRQGIAYVPQELAPIPDLRVYENMFLGEEKKSSIGFANRKVMVRETAAQLSQFGLDVDPLAKAGQLSVAEQQVLEIAKSIRHAPRIWILDEPTASLGDNETGHLFSLIERYKSQGTAIIYTTHRMDEIRRIADRVLVLRDGSLVLDRKAAEVSEDDLLAAMLGQAKRDMYARLPPVPTDADAALAVNGLRAAGLNGEFTIRVRRGEIVAIAGLVGSGRSELLEAIYGARKSAGTVRVAGRLLRKHDPAASISAGMVLVPEDRKGKGLILDLSILDNHTITRLDLFGRLLRKDGQRRQVSRNIAEGTLLRYRSLKNRVVSLSGGNQQKVLLGRALIGNVNVLLLDEPTRGVDVGARAELYAVIRGLLERGMGVLMVSSDRDEVVNFAHRVLVMRAGAIVAEVDPQAEDGKEQILKLALDYGEDPGIADTNHSGTSDNTVNADHERGK